MNEHVHSVADVLGPGGVIARRLPGYEPDRATGHGRSRRKRLG